MDQNGQNIDNKEIGFGCLISDHLSASRPCWFKTLMICSFKIILDHLLKIIRANLNLLEMRCSDGLAMTVKSIEGKCQTGGKDGTDGRHIL